MNSTWSRAQSYGSSIKVTNAALLVASAQAVTISSNLVVAGGALSVANGAGTNGFILQSQGPGLAPTWMTSPAATLLNSTNTWTGGNTYVSSSTFNGAVVVSTSIILQGSAGTNGQVLTSGGPGGAATWSTLTGASLASTQTWTGGNTYASSSTFNGTVLVSTNLIVNNGGIISGNGSGITNLVGGNIASGIVSAGVLPSTVAYTNIENNWSHAQTFGSSITVNNAALLGASAQAVTISSNLVVAGGALSVANGAGTNGFILQSQGPGLAPTWITSPAATLLNSTNTWTAGNTYLSSSTYGGAVLISTTVILQGSTGSNGQVFTSGGPGAAATWSTLTGASLASTQTWTGGNTYVSSSTFNGTVLISTNLIVNNSGIISGNGSEITNLAAGQLTGTVGTNVLPSSGAYTTANQLWSGVQTLSSSFTVNNAALLGPTAQAVTNLSNLVGSGALVANNSAGTNGYLLSSQGPGTTPTWVASPASTLLTSTNTWPAWKTFMNQTTFTAGS